MELATLLGKCRDYKKIYLYGAGSYGKIAKLFLEQNGVEIAAFLQTDVEFGNDSFRKTPILRITDTEISEEDLVLVCTGKLWQDEILSGLKEKSVRSVEVLEKRNYELMRENISFEKNTDVINNKYVQVLLFHRVIEKNDDPWRLEISPQRFEEYMSYIANNYNVKRFEDDWSNVKEKTIVVTFDDGYWDNYHYALPILEKYHIPATIFVSTGNIGTANEFWWDRLARLVTGKELVDTRNRLRQLTPADRDEAMDEIEKRTNSITKPFHTDRALDEDELKKLADSELITIGGHTVNHNALASQSYEEQKYEIESSKWTIEKIIGREISAFSYPFGQRDTYSYDTIRIVRDCGFKKAASTVNKLTGCNADQYEIPRIGQLEVSLNEFAKKLDTMWYMDGDN